MKNSNFYFFRSLIIIFSLVTFACAQNGQPGTGITKEQAGTVLGGIGGGLAGNQFGKGKGKTAATIGGAVLGGLLGNSVGQSLDKSDQLYANSSINNALETSRSGATSSWVNPDSGHSGTITPTNTYVNSSGQNCREFSQTVLIAGQKQNSYGYACRQSDGTWRIQ